MRRFELHLPQEGFDPLVPAEGVEFADGRVVVAWRSMANSLEFFPGGINTLNISQPCFEVAWLDKDMSAIELPVLEEAVGKHAQQIVDDKEILIGEFLAGPEAQDDSRSEPAAD